MGSSQLDLSELARERPQREASALPRRRPWFTRYVLPSLILGGFLLLLALATFEQFLPRTPVTVVPVVVTRADIQQAGTPLFQAAGWIEPRPTAINVAALTEGVVQELLVVEGQQVQAGEPVARLIEEDAKLALRQAEATRNLRQAELLSAQAELKAAQARVENPVHLQASLADAQSLLAKTDTEMAKLPFLVATAEARVSYARQNLAGKQSAEEAIAGRLVQQAKSDLATAEAELEELRQRTPLLEREAEALRSKVSALTKQRELLIEESRQLANAQAQCQAAEARLQEAELFVEKAQLAVSRTVVRAPTAGRVLSLIAQPGSRVMGMESTAGHNSSTVVALYDPAMLQVRADVRLEDVPMVQPGQPVEIETASSRQPFRGTVLLPTSSANIQKNTLEVKVAIDQPPPTVRPEMLVTATFLAPPSAAASSDEAELPQRLLIPRQLVQQDSGEATVWLVAADGTARRQVIELGRGNGQLVEAVTGLRPTDKLISAGRETLQSGTRITISGEDPTLGRQPASP